MIGKVVEKYVKDKEVILFGGSAYFELPELDKPVIISTNNHFFWQEGKGGYGYTDGVYHGAGIAGFQASFMNQPPKALKFVLQNAGGAYGPSMEGWAKFKGLDYACYGNMPAETLKRGVSPDAYEDDFRELIDICKAPFTGVIAAYHLTRFPLKALHLCGFNFYSNAKATIKDGKRGEHDIEENKQGMRKVLEDDRCYPDRFLQESL